MLIYCTLVVLLSFVIVQKQTFHALQLLECLLFYRELVSILIRKFNAEHLRACGIDSECCE